MTSNLSGNRSEALIGGRSSYIVLAIVYEWQTKNKRPQSQATFCDKFIQKAKVEHCNGCAIQHPSQKEHYYKITKILRALWLAERSVCMRVCKRGCGVKMFCFSRANHVSTNLKKFLSSKLDKVTLFTHSFVGWNLENLYKQAVSTFFRLSWHFKREKSVFCKASFCKTRTDYACKTSWTRLCDWQEFLF